MLLWRLQMPKGVCCWRKWRFGPVAGVMVPAMELYNGRVAWGKSLCVHMLWVGGVLHRYLPTGELDHFFVDPNRIKSKLIVFVLLLTSSVGCWTFCFVGQWPQFFFEKAVRSSKICLEGKCCFRSNPPFAFALQYICKFDSVKNKLAAMCSSGKSHEQPLILDTIFACALELCLLAVVFVVQPDSPRCSALSSWKSERDATFMKLGFYPKTEPVRVRQKCEDQWSHAGRCLGRERTIFLRWSVQQAFLRANSKYIL